MNSKTIYLLAILCYTLFSCEKFYDKDYKLSVNTMENIKSKNIYGSIILTMEKYNAKDKEILASFIYKEKKASIKLNFDLSKHELEFINIGRKSDYFLFAISDLFDEKLLNPQIKNSTVFSFDKKGDNPRIDLFDKDNEYLLFYKPNLDVNGSVQMRMKIDMEMGIIEFWEKNGGIAKANFVKAFEKNK